MAQVKIEILFEGQPIRTLEVESQSGMTNSVIARLILRFGLKTCWDTAPSERCPREGGLHAHIPAHLVREQPAQVGERARFAAYIPELGELSFTVGVRYPAPPPVTFREVPSVR